MITQETSETDAVVEYLKRCHMD